MWNCPKCGECIADQFDSCWKCAAQPEPPAPLTKPSAWRRFLLLGFFFEGLLLLCFALPEGAWLSIQIRNFALISHYPCLAILDGLRIESDVLGFFGLAFGFSLMVLLWSCCFRGLSALTARLFVRLGLSRKQKFLVGCVFGGLCLVAGAAAILDGLNDKPKPFVPSSGLKTAVAGNTALALDLYRQLAAQPDEERNLFFSPYSASVALAMTYAGARGQAESEMAAVLHSNQPQTNLHAAFGELAVRLETLQRLGRITLTTANSIWCQQDDPFTEAFLEVTRTHYRATARLVDFKHDAQAAGDAINQWIERSTKGKIKGMVREQELTPDLSLILCNAIYFHGRWSSPFKRGATRPAPFHLTKEQSVSVPMMFQLASFKTAHVSADDFLATLLEMPYFGRDLSMIVLLPYEMDGLAELERRLTAENLQDWLAELDRAAADETHVQFPRFTTTSSLDLVPVLKSLGMVSAFDRTTADFSGIDGQNNLYLSRALQNAFVEVNEEGTKATAVTLFGAKSKGGPSPFNADHPFVFMIRENATGSILFLGRVVDPTK